MAKTDLTAQQVRDILHYDPETGIFTWLPYSGKKGRVNAGDVAGCLRASGYIFIGTGNAIYRAHRLAWLYMTGEWPKHQIDHINGDRSDNRWVNLRDLTNAINCQNIRVGSRKNSCFGLLGVSRNHFKFMAAITVSGKRTYLGTYETPELAHEAYIAAKRQFHEGCTI